MWEVPGKSNLLAVYPEDMDQFSSVILHHIGVPPRFVPLFLKAVHQVMGI